ncbi:hypothetical protein AYK21_05190 [Thermoplasmatales archaeon SG8-52-2]|nr:MAG: hypothetical protein AYK21_05190 [Thermoplasmatales archaeon SG8-52-2]
MCKKLVGIFIMMLLITTAISAAGNINQKVTSIEKSPVIFQPLGGGLDQQQTNQEGQGLIILPSQWLAQGFKPTVEKLAAVQLFIFKHDNPQAGIEIFVSIRDSINGSDLVLTSVSADQVEDYKWVTFNFPEINVTPEKTYYIVCRSDGGSGTDVYCWFYGSNNPYDRGDAWVSLDQGENWDKIVNYNNPDFCFKTYSKNTRSRTHEMNNLFLRFLENHPHIFLILRQLLGII